MGSLGAGTSWPARPHKRPMNPPPQSLLLEVPAEKKGRDQVFGWCLCLRPPGWRPCGHVCLYKLNENKNTLTSQRVAGG